MALLGSNGLPVGLAPEPAPDEPKAPRRVTTAFVVFQMPNGRWAATDDLEDIIVPARKPHLDDMVAGAQNVIIEITTKKTADRAASLVIGTLDARQAEMQERMLNAQVAAQLGGK